MPSYTSASAPEAKTAEITPSTMPSTRKGIRTKAFVAPTDFIMLISKRREYIAWARKKGAVIIEDDYDSEFSILKKPEDTLFSLEPEKTVIYINTFSGTIASSLRIGYMVLPAVRARQLKEKVDFYACSVPVFEQYVLAQLIENGDFERHINRVRRIRRRMREG